MQAPSTTTTQLELNLGAWEPSSAAAEPQSPPSTTEAIDPDIDPVNDLFDPYGALGGHPRK